jgi:type VI secretion system protein ImpB
MESAHFVRLRIGQFDIVTAKQCLPKTAAFQKIEILLVQDPVPGELSQRLAGRFVEAVIEHLEVTCFAEVLKVMRRGLLDELMKIERLGDFGQFVMKQMAFLVVEDGFEFGLHPKPVFIFGLLRVGDEFREGFCLAHAFFRGIEALHMKEHHFPQHVAHVTAGKCVVADKSNALRREPLPAESQNVLADFSRHPREQSVRNDVIELSPTGIDVRDISVDEPDVSHSQLLDHLRALGDGPRGEIDADELAPGQCGCHGRQIAAGAAAQFQDPATVHARRVHAEERADHRQPARMGLEMSINWVSDDVVTGRTGLHYRGLGLVEKKQQCVEQASGRLKTRRWNSVFNAGNGQQILLTSKGNFFEDGVNNPVLSEVFFMAKSSSQKFIARNRAPRVQIEYDVEVYGAEKKIELPFVMGVMADLSGKPAEALPAVGDRKFLEIDVDNFDDRLKACKPRVAFQVPNTLTGEGNLNVEMTFESMEDFSPAAVARKVDSLNKLLQARTELSSLLTYMDGKDKAEELVAKLLNNPDLMKSLATAPAATPEQPK